MINNILKNLATVGPVGYYPASGTLGSLIGIILMNIIKKTIVNDRLIILLLVASLCLAFISIYSSLRYFSTKDPSQVIIDEVVASMIALYKLPLSLKSTLICFVIFRFFDISKLGGLAKIEQKLSGTLPILLDDLLAAFYANLLTRLLL